LVAAALLSLVLAGCTAGTANPSASSTSGPPPLQATATTGVIRGVVVDDAIRPLGNVSVAAHGPNGENRTATTDLQGFFAFQALAPGGWFVKAHKRAYSDVQQDVDVAAGVGDPRVVKLQLMAIPGLAPFVNSFTVDAFVECIIPGANVCAILNLYPCAVAGYCNNATSDTSYVLVYEPLVALQRVPDWTQAELVWDSTQAVSDWLNIRYSAHEPADGAGLDARQAGARGPSPIVMPLNHTTAETWETGVKKGISYEIFGCMEAVTPYITGCVGFVLNQRVTFYFNVFYGYEPPEGWVFAKDGTVPPPPQ
jgi:hypothetical protein